MNADKLNKMSSQVRIGGKVRQRLRLYENAVPKQTDNVNPDQPALPVIRILHNQFHCQLIRVLCYQFNSALCYSLADYCNTNLQE